MSSERSRAHSSTDSSNQAGRSASATSPSTDAEGGVRWAGRRVDFSRVGARPTRVSQVATNEVTSTQLDGVGHYAAMEAPLQLSATIRRFIESVDTSVTVS